MTKSVYVLIHSGHIVVKATGLKSINEYIKTNNLKKDAVSIFKQIDSKTYIKIK